MAEEKDVFIRTPGELLNLCIQLSSDFKNVRDDAFNRIKHSLGIYAGECPLDYLSMMRLCKALFIYVWKEDKVSRQFEICAEIGDLCWDLPCYNEYNDDNADFHQDSSVAENGEEEQEEEEKEEAVGGEADNAKEPKIREQPKIDSTNEEENGEEAIGGEDLEEQNEDEENEEQENVAGDEENEADPYGGQFVLYWRCWLETFCREWTKVDYQRITKAMSLVRSIIHSVFLRAISGYHVREQDAQSLKEGYVKRFEDVKADPEMYFPYKFCFEIVKKVGEFGAEQLDLRKTWNSLTLPMGDSAISELTAVLHTFSMVILSPSRISSMLTPLSVLYHISNIWVSCLRHIIESLSYIGCYISKPQFAEMAMCWVEFVSKLSQSQSRIVKKIKEDILDHFVEDESDLEIPQFFGAYIGRDIEYFGAESENEVNEENVAPDANSLTDGEKKESAEEAYERPVGSETPEEMKDFDGLGDLEEMEDAEEVPEEEETLSLPQMIWLLTAGNRIENAQETDIKCRSKYTAGVLEYFAGSLEVIRDEWEQSVQEDEKKLSELLEKKMEEERKRREEEERKKREEEERKRKLAEEQKRNANSKKDKKTNTNCAKTPIHTQKKTAPPSSKEQKQMVVAPQKFKKNNKH